MRRSRGPGPGTGGPALFLFALSHGKPERRQATERGPESGGGGENHPPPAGSLTGVGLEAKSGGWWRVEDAFPRVLGNGMRGPAAAYPYILIIPLLVKVVKLSSYPPHPSTFPCRTRLPAGGGWHTALLGILHPLPVLNDSVLRFGRKQYFVELSPFSSDFRDRTVTDIIRLQSYPVLCHTVAG